MNTLIFNPVKSALPMLALLGCVTINVYFPEAAAEKAADRIIEEVIGPSQAESSTQPQSSMAPLFNLAGKVMDFIIPPARAQADIDISTPEIRALTHSMKDRHVRLKPYYESGAIGITGNGDLAIRDQNAIPLAERNMVKKLVADENSDRAALYREIAVANGHPDWEDDIRRTFGNRWIANAKKGWYYQDGGWNQK